MKRLSNLLLLATLLIASHAAVATESRVQTLPDKVREMREMILHAARTGDFNALTEAIQWNELPPSFAPKKVDDPIAHFKNKSIDGDGYEMLGILRTIMESTHVVRKPSNGKPDFIWPAAAEKPWSKLTPAEKTDALRLLPQAEAKAFMNGAPWTYYSVMIGHDGTWHSFEK